MKKIILLSATVLLMGALASRGADLSATQATNVDLHLLDSNSDQLYRNYEISLEAFGIVKQDESGRGLFNNSSYHRHPQGGAGAGLEFFFCKYVGVEAEGFSDTTHHSFVNDIGGNLVLRYPLGQSGFSPYIFGGAGHQFYRGDTGYEDGGLGLEFRFSQYIGIFADGRFTVTERYDNYAMGRVGMKFTF